MQQPQKKKLHPEGRKFKRDYAKRAESGPFMFSETFTGPHGTNAFCMSGWSLKKIYHSERCLNNMNEQQCKEECTCELELPPWLWHKDKMEVSLFKHPRPFLLYSIYRGTEEGAQRINFSCKLEQEVFEYTKKLNAKERKQIWFYREEAEFNHWVKVQYEYFKTLGMVDSDDWQPERLGNNSKLSPDMMASMELLSAFLNSK